MAAKRPHPEAVSRESSNLSKRFHADEEEALVDGVYLNEESLTLITQLFKVIDRNSDGKLDVQDFSLDGRCSNAYFQKWQQLRQEFDLNGDGQVTLDEFRKGFKKMVLALGCKVFATNFLDLTIDKCLRELEQHINAQVQELCKQAFDWYTSTP